MAIIFARYYPTFGVYRQILIKAPSTPVTNFAENLFVEDALILRTDAQTEGQDEVNRRLWQGTGRRQEVIRTQAISLGLYALPSAGPHVPENAFRHYRKCLSSATTPNYNKITIEVPNKYVDR